VLLLPGEETSATNWVPSALMDTEVIAGKRASESAAMGFAETSVARIASDTDAANPSLLEASFKFIGGLSQN
jgi:hypothetical protein